MILLKFSFSQEIEIQFDSVIDNDSLINIDLLIDPIFPHCYELVQKEKPPTFIDESNYYGKILITAICDTTELKLINHNIVIAKLKSKINPNDTIEFRFGNEFGNVQYLNALYPKLVKHIDYLKIRKTNFKNCKDVIFNIPIKINIE